jgi:hypothetical protein
LPRIPTAFLFAAVLGPLIFYLGWPRHWFDTFTRITDYIGRHWHHEHYFVQYFGEALVRPPFPLTYPLVMTLVTVPLVTLLTAALGGSALFGDWFGRRRQAAHERGGHLEGRPVEGGERPRRRSMVWDPRGTGVLIAVNILVPIAVIARPSSPVFGGTKHWMTAMPFLAVLSGWGVIWAVRQAWPRGGPRHRRARSSSRVRWLVMAAVIGILSAPLVHATLNVHPHGTAYYNELIGGVRGAADREMMRQFWGSATREAVGLLDREAPAGARVFTHNSTAWGWYSKDGLIRGDIHEVSLRGSHGLSRADYALFNHQRSFINTEIGTGRPGLFDIWRRYDTMAPIAVWGVDGVPMLSLYGTERVRGRDDAPPAMDPNPPTNPDPVTTPGPEPEPAPEPDP